MWDMDELCDYSNKNSCGSKRNKPKCSSVDAFAYLILNNENGPKIRFYLIEFKKIDLKKELDKNIIENIIKDIKIDANSKYVKYLSDLEYVKSFLGKEIMLKLRLKPYETLFSVFPYLYTLFDCTDEKNDVLNYMLFNCEHYYIIVSNVNEEIISESRTNKHSSLQRKFKNISRIKPNKFDKILLHDEDMFNNFTDEYKIVKNEK